MAGTATPRRRVDGDRIRKQLVGAMDDVSLLIGDSVEVWRGLEALHVELFGEESPSLRERRERAG